MPLVLSILGVVAVPTLLGTGIAIKINRRTCKKAWEETDESQDRRATGGILAISPIYQRHAREDLEQGLFGRVVNGNRSREDYRAVLAAFGFDNPDMPLPPKGFCTWVWSKVKTIAGKVAYGICCWQKVEDAFNRRFE